MALFFDASALAKLYVEEPGSDHVETLVASSNQLGGLFISELSRVEVVSAIMRHVRRKRMNPASAVRQCRQFDEDYRDTFDVVELNAGILSNAAALLQRHPGVDFRAGDAVQLACAQQAGRGLGLPVFTIIACDGAMARVARDTGYQVWDPERQDPVQLLRRHTGLWPDR